MSDSATPTMHVLLVTDDAMLRRLAIGLLEMKEHTASCCSSAAEAAEASLPDRNRVVMLDLNLPETPADAIRLIRAAHPTVPVVGIVPTLAPDQVDRAGKLGVAQVLETPLQPDELYRTLATCAGQHDTDNQSAAIDLGVARGHIMGGDDALVELIDVMLSETRRFLSDIDAGLASGAHEEVERGAHSLKGAARVFGAEAVVEIAYQVERLARDQDLNGAAALMPDTQQAAERMLAALQEARQQLP